MAIDTEEDPMQTAPSRGAPAFPQPRPTITERDLGRLPEPVQRYLEYAGVVGKEAIRTVHLRQTGFFRMKPSARWRPLTAEQSYRTDTPSFIWSASVKMLPFAWMSGGDAFRDGRGNFVMKLMSLLKVVDEHGPEIATSELLRYLSEIVWFPTAWLSPTLLWEEIDARSARATIQVAGVDASCVLHFNESDQVAVITAERPMQNGRSVVLAPWVAGCGDYRQAQGLMVPWTASAAWDLPKGRFTYARIALRDIEYDTPVHRFLA